MDSMPAFIQGVFSFSGEGFDKPVPLDGASYTVPYDKRSQLIYFRAGSSADELVTLVLMRNGKLMRYFPLGAKDAMHVPLAVVEDLTPESTLEVLVAAPVGVNGTAVLDIGFLEID